MENLHPAAQVVAIIVVGVCVCVAILASFTDFFNRR
jgi:hypothetical protein